MIWYYFCGFVVYLVAVSICYIPEIKTSVYYMPVGLICGLIANFLWLRIAKDVQDNGQLVVYGFYWDSMIVFMYGVLPIIAFGARLSLIQSIGAGLVVMGLLMIKS